MGIGGTRIETTGITPAGLPYTALNPSSACSVSVNTAYLNTFGVGATPLRSADIPPTAFHRTTVGATVISHGSGHTAPVSTTAINGLH
jgi:hypothetical protein